MAKVISIDRDQDDKARITVLCSDNELKSLGGEFDHVFLHTLSMGKSDESSHVTQRGKGGFTTYLLVPRKFREGICSGHAAICRRIDMEDSIAFVYFVKRKLDPHRKKEETLKKIESKYAGYYDPFGQVE